VYDGNHVVLFLICRAICIQNKPRSASVSPISGGVKLDQSCNKNGHERAIWQPKYEKISGFQHYLYFKVMNGIFTVYIDADSDDFTVLSHKWHIRIPHCANFPDYMIELDKCVSLQVKIMKKQKLIRFLKCH
jgi:hypothetical protein